MSLHMKTTRLGRSAQAARTNAVPSSARPVRQAACVSPPASAPPALRSACWSEARPQTISRNVVVCAAAVAAEPEVIRQSKHDAGLRVEVRKTASGYEVDLQAEPMRPMLLHWAIEDWKGPPQELWPANTHREGDKAAQTRFGGDGRIHMSFTEAQCPQKLVFVLKELSPENWLNDGGTDFSVQLKPPKLSNVADKVIAAEATNSHWSLFNRFCMCIEVLDAADTAGPEGMALIFTWLRLSSLRQLEWYRNSNYQSKDIAHVQKTLAERIAAKARGSKDPTNRLLARMAMEGLPRGGGNGDDIRMGILHIMRGHGIKEGHRPGIDEQFLEQWHQKLHTNTTPDDIAICEAYLAFLHSGNHDDYWRVLWDVGRLTKKDLENFGKPIKAWPMHLPHLIDPFKHYRWLLKVTHSGADLDTAAEMCKGVLDGELKGMIYDLLGNRNEWWAAGKVVEIRERLAGYWKAKDSQRDLLLLDIALDNWFRLSIDRVDKASLQGDALLDLVTLVMRNTLITVDDVDLSQALAQWEWIKQGAGQGERWNQQWGMSALAALQRMELSLAAHMDKIYSLVQPHAEAFGEACKLDKKYIMNFGEEVVRGRSLFVLSPLLQTLEPMLRSTAGMAPWQVISNGSGTATGAPLVIGSLAEIQGKAFPAATVVLAAEVGGNEDIPLGVQAVITRSATDVLSHAAIRARAQRVLLATCYDAAEWDAMVALATESAGASLTIAVTPEGDVRAARAEAGAGAGAGATNGSGPSITLQPPEPTDLWVLEESQFAPGLVGAKSLNCMALAKARGSSLPEHINVPPSLTVPLGSFERVLSAPENADVAAKLADAQARIIAAASAAEATGTDMAPALQVLSEVRALVASKLVAPEALRADLSAAAAGCGMIPDASTWAAGSAAWATAWSAISKVWASKWNDRAWLSRRAVKVPDDQLYMAVLLQQVVPADYAFVLHTAHPVTSTPGLMVGEVVPGMGEALVGNYPGRALSFSCQIDGGGAPAVSLASLPSKRVVLRCNGDGSGLPVLIARSDANGEDLQDMAGAGLYDSVPFFPLEETSLNAVSEPLVTDPAFRAQLLAQLVDVGRSVKEAFGGEEQDIEGVLSGGNVWVVQSRPQVMHN